MSSDMGRLCPGLRRATILDEVDLKDYFLAARFCTAAAVRWLWCGAARPGRFLWPLLAGVVAYAPIWLCTVRSADGAVWPNLWPLPCKSSVA